MTSVLPRAKGLVSVDDLVDVDELEAESTDIDAAPTVVAKSSEELTDQQRQMLVFERQWWRHAGSKEQAIREQFNLSATRYYQMLNRLLDTPAALEFDALVVGRLRRLRATRARTRAAN